MFYGKKIIITGGSSGVGKVLAFRLINQGADIAIVARDKKKLTKVKKDLQKIASSKQKVDAFAADVADNKSVETIFKQIANSIGEPDILINSAGILREGYFENQSIDLFHEVINVNFFGTLHCIKAVLPFLKAKGSGRIVNICSVAGLMGVFGYSAYCASKHAVTGLSGSLRTELKHQNIAIHIVYPPEFDSPMVDEINTYRTDENRYMAQTIPLLSAETVADEIIRGVKKNRYEITPGLATRFVTRFERLIPSLGRAVTDFKIKSKYKGPEN